MTRRVSEFEIVEVEGDPDCSHLQSQHIGGGVWRCLRCPREWKDLVDPGRMWLPRKIIIELRQANRR